MKCCVFSAAKHLSLILHINRWHVTGPRTPLRTLHTCMSTAGFLLQTWACISCYLYSYQISSHKQDCQVIESLWPIMVQCLVYFCIGPCFHEHYNLWLSTIILHGPDSQREPNISQKICCDMSLISDYANGKMWLESFHQITYTIHIISLYQIFIYGLAYSTSTTVYIHGKGQNGSSPLPAVWGARQYILYHLYARQFTRSIQLGRKEGSN